MKYKSRIVIKKINLHDTQFDNTYNLLCRYKNIKNISNRKYYIVNWEFRLDYIEDYINEYRI